MLEARAKGKPHDRNLRRLVDTLARSRQALEQRTASVPALVYPEALPISAHRDELAAALRAHQVVVVCGETGSGKSTQLPKVLLELGYGVDGPIGHTQPRRLAARSLARRLADELGPTGADLVASTVRFDDRAGPSTLVRYLTDGVLLAQTRKDPALLHYSALIIDEAHERSLNIDFLLGYLRRLLPRRPDLRVVITSATIDTERFAAFFGKGPEPAPVLEVSGRGYPVEVRYRPPEPDEATGEVDWPAAIAEACDELLREGPGDVLVFLPTQRLIQETARHLEGHPFPRNESVELLPLYARLALKEQQRLFARGDRRRIVLATNVAESSVTVPGIVGVVDTGLARISRYSPRARIQRLPIEDVARASADQRAGRCGRVAPGVCIRLYEQADLEKRPAFATPEIQRSNLAAVVLSMTALRLGRIEDFPFLDPPRRAMVQDGYRTLRELSALDDQGRLTALGQELARLPVDPRIGRMILAARDEGCLEEVLILAAAFETADPRLRPPGQEQAADAAHAPWVDGDSDMLARLALWDHVTGLRDQLGSSAWRRRLRAEFLSVQRVREWMDVHRQLADLMGERGLVATPTPGGTDQRAIHRALLSGLLCYVAHRTEKGVYQGSDGKPLAIWPGSGLSLRNPRWIVAAEVVETSRRYARTVARVDARDIEEVAGDLVSVAWRDPFWDRDSGRVLAWQKLSLWDLPLVPRRRAPFERVDPVLARELFIRHGLAEGQLETGAPFLAHNLALANQVAALEARTRRRDLLADLDARFDFYDRRLPDDVVGAASFHRWRRRTEKAEPDLLFMQLDDLLRGDADEPGQEAFPDALELEGGPLPLRYHLRPGEEDDGVTLEVPVERLAGLDAERLEWLVPGLLKEKVVALMRSLPKALRRTFVPVPTRADEALALMEHGRGRLTASLAAALQRVGGQPVAEQALDASRLPEHLRLRVEVLGADGAVLAAGRDLDLLRAGLRQRTHQAVDALADSRWRRTGCTSWEFGELPERVAVPADGGTVTAYPALVDEGDSVGLTLMPRARDAALSSRLGLQRLVRLAHQGRLRHRLQRHPRWQALLLAFATAGDGAELLDQLVDRCVRRTWLQAAPTVRDAQAFETLLAFGEVRMVEVLDQVVAAADAALAAAQRVRLLLDEVSGRPWGDTHARLAAHLEALLEGRFLAEGSWERFIHLHRYLGALERRIERIATRGTAADGELDARVRRHRAQLATLPEPDGAQPELEQAVDRYAWLVEEFAVSTFAQELGTATKVSERRLEKQRQLIADLARA